MLAVDDFMLELPATDEDLVKLPVKLAVEDFAPELVKAEDDGVKLAVWLAVDDFVPKLPAAEELLVEELVEPPVEELLLREPELLTADELIPELLPVDFGLEDVPDD